MLQWLYLDMDRIQLIKINSFHLAVVSSLLIHSMAFTLPSLFVKREPMIKDYMRIELMTLEPAIRSAAAFKKSSSNEVKISKNKDDSVSQKMQQPVKEETENNASDEGEDNGEGEGNFESYVPSFRVLKLPQFVTRVQPEYPQKAKLKGIEAEVLVEVYIDTKGHPRKVVVLKSGGEDFDQVTVAAVYKSVFSPAISRDGKPLPVRARIPYTFELE